MRESKDELVGFRAVGRYGELGVVESERHGDGSSSLVVRGGVSAALVYVVPHRYVGTVSRDLRTVDINVDLRDFVPTLRADGIVELRLPSG